MNFYKCTEAVLFLFMVCGACDELFDGRFGLGREFRRGFAAAGPLLMLMAGYICLSPVLARALRPLLSPVFSAVGADPSLFAGMFFGVDAGGAPFAAELARDPQIGVFSGYIVGSVLGPTLTFTIPVAVASARSEKARRCVICGLLAGIISAPVGIFAGGLALGVGIGPLMRNLAPILFFVALLYAGLRFFTGFIMKFFAAVGKISLAGAFAGLAAGAAQKLFGITVLQGMTPIDEAFLVVGGIAVILAGTFPLIAVITRLLSKKVDAAARRLRISPQAVSGLLSTLANSIAMFESLDEMDDRGKIINVAFAVSAAWVFGDHLGYVSQTRPDVLLPVIAGKLAAGAAAIAAALLLCRKAPADGQRAVPQR